MAIPHRRERLALHAADALLDLLLGRSHSDAARRAVGVAGDRDRGHAGVALEGDRDATAVEELDERTKVVVPGLRPAWIAEAALDLRLRHAQPDAGDALLDLDDGCCRRCRRERERGCRRQHERAGTSELHDPSSGSDTTARARFYPRLLRRGVAEAKASLVMRPGRQSSADAVLGACALGGRGSEPRDCPWPKHKSLSV